MRAEALLSRDLAKRRFLLRPAEPAGEFLLRSPGESVYVARTEALGIPWAWDFNVLTNPHLVCVGLTGSGKSYFVKTFLTRASLVMGANALILDWAGEYTPWVEASGGLVLKLGKGGHLNLLDPAGATSSQRAQQVLRAFEILTDLAGFPAQRRFTHEAIEESYKVEARPTLRTVERLLSKRLGRARREERSDLEAALHRVRLFTKPGQDFFAERSTLRLEELLERGLVSVDLSGLPDEVFRSLAALTLLQFVRERMRAQAWQAQKGVRLFVVLDEAWKIAKDDRSDAVAIVREGRKYHFSLLVASQNPTDVSEAIFSNAGSTLVFRTRHKPYLDYLQGTLGFSQHARRRIVRLGVGEAYVSLAFSHSAQRDAFFIRRVDGEEPLETVALEPVGGENMGEGASWEKNEFFRRLRQRGLSDLHAKSLEDLLAREGHRLPLHRAIEELERFGLSRVTVTSFLKEEGVRDAELAGAFGRVDRRRSDAEKLVEVGLDG